MAGMRYLCAFVAFVVGAAVMAFELAGARLLMPRFGSGLEAWAAVIAVTLAALAAGAWAGGRIADRRPGAGALAAVLTGAGTAVLAIRLGGPALVPLCARVSSCGGVWCAAAAILSAPLFLLGTVQPILVKLLARGAERTGTAAGNVIALGTLGGVLGTILCAVALLPGIGVGATMLTISVTVYALAAAAWCAGRRTPRGNRALLVAAVVGATLAMLPAPSVREGPMRVLEEVEGLYGHLEVLEYGGMRALVADGVFQTVVPVSGAGIARGSLLRSKDFVELVPYVRPGARNALLVGLGAGLHARALALYGIEVESVELEREVARLAATHFALACTVSIGDGRAFLEREARRFDAIIIDTFVGGGLPEHLYTREAFETARERLADEGVLVVHLIGMPGHRAVRTVAATLAAAFPHLQAVRSGLGDELQHIYLLASRAALELGPWARRELERHGVGDRDFFVVDISGAPVLTDDRMFLAALAFDVVAAHREESAELRRNPPW